MKIIKTMLLVNTCCALMFAQGVYAAGDNEIEKAIATKEPKEQVDKVKVDAVDAGNDNQSCDGSADIWMKDNVKAHSKNNTILIVFDESNGGVCFRRGSKREYRVSEGDKILVGVYGNKANLDKYRLDAVSCNLEEATPKIFDSVPKAIEKQSAANGLRIFDAIECYSAEVTLQVRKSDNSLAYETKIKQYERYDATFQVGVLWTDLDDATYSVFDDGQGNKTIRSDTNDNKGPQYVGSVVIYGIGYQVAEIFGGPHYSGRDIVNENKFLDRLGFGLSVGLDNPKDTFGFGLSFELFSGINLTATRLYRNIEVLDDYAVGDTFTGSQIPQKKSWEHDTVFGLSIDGRYLAKYFSSEN